jgi:hypothetical protein
MAINRGPFRTLGRYSHVYRSSPEKGNVAAVRRASFNEVTKRQAASGMARAVAGAP